MQKRKYPGAQRDLQHHKDWRSNQTMTFLSMVRGEEVQMAAYKPTMSYRLIYIFTIHDAQHEGYWKIGKTNFDSVNSYKQASAQLCGAELCCP